VRARGRARWAGAIAAVCLAVVVTGCAGAEPGATVQYDLAYTAMTDEGEPALYLADREGRQQARQISTRGEAVSGLEWSPDGERLAFAVCEDDDGERCTMYTVAASGEDQQRLGEGAAPHWSADGRRIAFVKAWGQAGELYLTDSDRDAPRRKTLAGAEGDGGVVPSEASPWSPDGRMLAVTRRLEGADGSAVVLLGGDGQAATRVAGDLEGAVFDGWSPDGARMLLFGRPGGGGRQLYVAAADGSGARTVAEAPGAPSKVSAAWSADGRRVVLASEGGVSVIEADSLEARVVMRGECAGEDGVAWGSRGTVWFTRGCDEGTRVLVEADVATGTERTVAVSAVEFAVVMR